MAEDNQGYISATMVEVKVTSQQTQTTISDLQTMSGWQSSSAMFPAARAATGRCAAGLGTVVSTMSENQATPSQDGKSARFTMGGPTPYSNELYFNAIAGGDNVSHFIYDLYFYLDNAAASQALEFDLNQTFGGQRLVWGRSVISRTQESGISGMTWTAGNPRCSIAIHSRQTPGSI